MRIANHPYQYYLLPSANPPAHLAQVHNRVYKFWMEIWTGVLQGLNADPGHLADDFLRQDFIAAICSGTDVVAVHLYSIFSLDTLAARGHRYMTDHYPEVFFQRLSELGVRTVMSLEYLTVNPGYRKQPGKVHIGAVTGALGLRVMNQYGVDAVIAPARRDHKIHEMAYAQGGDCVVPEVSVHNVSCDLIAIRREKIICPDPQVAELRDDLWKNRVHFTATEAVRSLRETGVRALERSA